MLKQKGGNGTSWPFQNPLYNWTTLLASLPFCVCHFRLDFNAQESAIFLVHTWLGNLLCILFLLSEYIFSLKAQVLLKYGFCGSQRYGVNHMNWQVDISIVWYAKFLLQKHKLYYKLNIKAVSYNHEEHDEEHDEEQDYKS